MRPHLEPGVAAGGDRQQLDRGRYDNAAAQEIALMKSRLAAIPFGAWPRRMNAEYAAGYCGERTVRDFERRVGKGYPRPRVAEGRRRLWLRDDLDAAIAPTEMGRVRSIAEDL
jgi:hypothetical protein